MLLVQLPAFRLERCGFTATDVVGLLDVVKQAARLVALTPSAAELGLRRGMTAAEARALVPEVELIELDAVGEEEDRRALVRALEALSDRVGPAPWSADDALVIDLTHSARALGGEEQAARRALELVGGFGHAAAVVVADDPRAALALATTLAPGDEPLIVPAGELRPHLASLPVGALAAHAPGGEELLAALEAVGVETLGDFAALDPASVIGRYGAAAARIHGVARGGVDRRAPVELVEGDLPSVRTALAGATTRAEIAFALPGLLAVLCERLEELDLAVVRLRVVLHWELGDRRSTAVSVRIGRPTRSVRSLERLVRTRLERLDLGSPDEPPVPIDELVLEVEEAASDRGWQPGLADRAEGGEPLPDLLSRLSDQLGEQALFSPVLADSWRPEASWAPGPFPSLRTASPRARSVPEDPVDLLEHREHDFPLPRPTLLLTRPVAVDVSCDELGPTRVRFEQSWRPIDRRAGPERLQGEWWSPTGWLDREYWSVEVDGRCAWIFRDGGGWAVHGWFD